jgi:hypothetical protein
MDLQTREEFMSDQQVPVLCLHVNFSSLANPLEPHPEITWAGTEAETKAACTPQRNIGGLFCLVSLQAETKAAFTPERLAGSLFCLVSCLPQ